VLAFQGLLLLILTQDTLELSVVVWWIDPAWTPGAHQSCSISPPPQLDRAEKNIMKGSWAEIRTGRLLSSYRHWQNRLYLGKKIV